MTLRDLDSAAEFLRSALSMPAPSFDRHPPTRSASPTPAPNPDPHPKDIVITRQPGDIGSSA